MRRYRVLAKSFINGSLVEAGEIVSLPSDQATGSNLEPIDDGPHGPGKPRPIPQRRPAGHAKAEDPAGGSAKE